MIHVPVALITEKLRGQTLEDDIKVPRDGALQIEGKNVWLSLDGEGKDQQTNRDRQAVGASPTCPHTHLHGSGPVAPGSNVLHRHSSSPSASLATHRYTKNRTLFNRPVCDAGQGTLLAPPKKKHCRSLSVPADNPPTGAGVMSTSPQVEGARVWRPIPVTLLNSSGSGCIACLDNRNPGFAGSSLHDEVHGLGNILPVASCSRFHRDFKITGHIPGVCAGGSGCTIASGVPVAPSPLSIDSGRDTTSDLQTPPCSPVPRPSSAASLRSHASSCFSAPWLDRSPGRLRYDALQSRSLSFEEHMSSGLTSGSTPCVMGTGSVPLSPCRNKIPRCHSQPCVLHDRRCGKKRRRDTERPTLDFHKMTETAYPGNTTSQITPAQDIQSPRWRSDMDYMCVGGLMPIASSPQDTDLPATPQASDHAALHGTLDMEVAACLHLPATPPNSEVSSGIDIREPVKLLGEEEEEECDEEESNCSCHRDLRGDDGGGFFPLTDLDLEQIESH
ncbi:protein FAM53A-like isoform X2 [Pomacea canaliculata]|uniref:protein FAM53A-like isoform X2 n=1 Tax=Pomacea canaliculata TaxID=400727 RepID=UPI000D72E637|nr:protein FAM53A-like isoform X2 [Pomacea canaliculata]